MNIRVYLLSVRQNPKHFSYIIFLNYFNSLQDVIIQFYSYETEA